MALALNDRVQQTGTANTTVSFTLSGAVVGFQSFAVIGNTNTTYYAATDTTGNFEVGIGTYSTTGPTLTRTTILSSSNANAAVTFSGTVSVFVTYPSSKSVNLNETGNASSLGTPVAFVGTNITGTASSLTAGLATDTVTKTGTGSTYVTNTSPTLVTPALGTITSGVGTALTGVAKLTTNTFTGAQTLNTLVALNTSISTLASSATPDIWTGTSNLINYTGTTTATGFATAPQAGVSRTLILAGAASFTAGANMLIDGVVSFTGAAGDEVEVFAVTTTQFRLRPKLASGAAINSTGFKNKIIGGDFTINPWQRGTNFPAIVSGAYSADRFVANHTTTAAVTASKAADAPTATQAGSFTQHCISLAVTTADTAIAAGDVWLLVQRIEGLNAASFGFGQAGSRNVTLSFWVKGTKTGVHCIALRNNGNDRSYVAEYTIVTTNTWEYKTITIPVDTTGTWLYDTGLGVILSFSLMSGTTFQTTANTWAAGNFIATANQVNALDSTANVFKIALVQLEAGSVATSFDVRSVGQELALCQRYYETGRIYLIGYAVANGYIGLTVYFKATKRGLPTITQSPGAESVNVAAVTLNPVLVDGMRAYTHAIGAGNGYTDIIYTAAAEL